MANAGRVYSGGPSVTWAIFQGGAIVSNIRLQEALRDQAFITYQQDRAGRIPGCGKRADCI